jgi:hypothetical protein
MIKDAVTAARCPAIDLVIDLSRVRSLAATPEVICVHPVVADAVRAARGRPAGDSVPRRPRKTWVTGLWCGFRHGHLG